MRSYLEVVFPHLQGTGYDITSPATPDYNSVLLRPPEKMQNYLEEKITWKPGPDPLYLYRAECEGAQCLIRINDFPDDHLYTLMVDDREVAHFDNWPPCWTRQ